jgi:hypothetical protein
LAVQDALDIVMKMALSIPLNDILTYRKVRMPDATAIEKASPTCSQCTTNLHLLLKS